MIYLLIQNLIDGEDSSNLLGTFTVWFFRDPLISYLFTLPVLWICLCFGVKSLLGFWGVGTIIGAPVGFILANPVYYAWTPTDEDFLLGPYWHNMVIYMVLFGLVGLAYYFSSRPRLHIFEITSMDTENN